MQLPSLTNSVKKTLGSGRSPAHALRRLGYHHKMILNLHLQGKTGPEIANVVGCSTSAVYSTLKDPLARVVIDHFNEGFDFDVKALYPKAIRAVSNALDAQDTDKALRGVDRFMRLAGIGETKPSDAGINVNIIGAARMRLVHELRGVIENNVIDIAAE